MRGILKFAPSWAFGALTLLALAAAAAAQTDTQTEPPTANAPAGSSTERVSPPEPGSAPEQLSPAEQPPKEKVSPAEQMTRFLGTAIPSTNYISSASRMAVAFAQNSKLRKLAGEIAKDQTSVANSLAAWVNVSGPVVTRQNPYAVGGGGAAKVAAPRLLPDQVSLLQQLSQLRGATFDSLYVSSLKETLVQLQALFREFGEGSGDAGLRAIAKRELPKLQETISALNAL